MKMMWTRPFTDFSLNLPPELFLRIGLSLYGLIYYYYYCCHVDSSFDLCIGGLARPCLPRVCSPTLHRLLAVVLQQVSEGSLQVL